MELPSFKLRVDTARLVPTLVGRKLKVASSATVNPLLAETAPPPETVREPALTVVMPV